VALIAGGPALAQQPQMRQQPKQAVRHAMIGKLVSFDREGETVGIQMPSEMRAQAGPQCDMPDQQNYKFDTATRVMGLEPDFSAGALEPQIGSLVLVEYQQTSAGLYTPEIYYIGTGKVRETHGTIVRVDPSGHTLTLQNPAGVDETIDVHNHAMVEHQTGLTNLAALQPGKDVTVYFIRQYDRNDGYLIHQMG
jgi:hypothetical protein